MKSKILIVLLVTGSFYNSFAQDKTVLSIFNDQVDAFNQADVERLVNNVSENFKYFYITSDELVLEVEGKENFKKSMEAYFKSGRKAFSIIENYSIAGNRISFKEMVSHKDENDKTVSSSALGIYEIKSGKITRSWYFID